MHSAPTPSGDIFELMMSSVRIRNICLRFQVYIETKAKLHSLELETIFQTVVVVPVMNKRNKPPLGYVTLCGSQCQHLKRQRRA